MEKNVGKIDRMVRVIIGLIFLIFGGIYYYSTTSPDTILTIIMFLAAIISLATGIIGYCTLYSIMDINTCSAE